MLNNLTLPRGLLCAFLLLACSSVEASISLSVPSQRNIVIFLQYAQVPAVTNSPVNTWAPACEVLKEKKVEGCSNKQSHYFNGILFIGLFGPVFFLGVLAIAYAGSSKKLSRRDKAIIGIAATVIVLALVGFNLVGLNRFAYMDDYSFPEYLVSSTSTNIVVVHEKMDVSHNKMFKSSRKILFIDRRIEFVSTNELAILLHAQAEEIRRFRQGTASTNQINLPPPAKHE